MRSLLQSIELSGKAAQSLLFDRERVHQIAFMLVGLLLNRALLLLLPAEEAKLGSDRASLIGRHLAGLLTLQRPYLGARRGSLAYRLEPASRGDGELLVEAAKMHLLQLHATHEELRTGTDLGGGTHFSTNRLDLREQRRHQVGLLHGRHGHGARYLGSHMWCKADDAD